MPTTVNPVFASSSAVREPVKPTPTVTTSTGLRRCAMFDLPVVQGEPALECSRAFACLARFWLWHPGVDAGIHMQVTVCILCQTHRRTVDFDAVLIYQFVIRRVGTGETDHPPRHHVAVAAIDRVAEEALDRALPKMGEEHIGRHAAKILATS